MKFTKYFVSLCYLILACNGFEASGLEACVEVRKTLGSSTQCENREQLLVFFQSSNIGNVVKFSFKNERKLRIECLNFRVGIDLNKIPRLNFERVNVIELNECSVSNETLLTTIKASFNIKKVKLLSITSTKEPNKFVVSEKFFENVSELEELEFKTNYRVNFSENTFNRLINLKTLKMQVHDIIDLPFNVFIPLKNVRTLAIANSGDEKYETKLLNITLSKCINMKSFTLTGIRWPILIQTGLINFVGPLKVSLRNNRIVSEISSKTFEKASHIEELNLNNNSIGSLPKDLFASQTSMKTVDLSCNKIKEISYELFKNTNSLKSINLSSNLIHAIDSKVFSNLNKLTNLNLAHNVLTQINFGPLKMLKNLELSYNRIQKFIGNLCCRNLTTLNLSHNNFKRFFVDQFWGFSLQNLTITLTQNNLESVDFRDLQVPGNLNTLKNLLMVVDDEITCNCHTLSLYNFTLRRLTLDSEIYRTIKVLPENIKCIKRSSETPLSVSDIQIKSITCPMDFPHQIFCPSFCVCDRRPFDGFLIVKCANISSVPLLPHFKMLNDIRLDKIELNIAGNGVRDLPSNLLDVNYNDVTKIHASHNSIQSIETHNIPDRLVFLDLKHNRLSQIPTDVIQKFTKLRFVHLSNNPWDCAMARDLVRFVKRYRNIEKDFNMIQCSNYKYFLEIDTEDQCNGEIVKTLVLALGLIAFLVTCFTYYIKREAITEWIFLKDKRHLLENIFEQIKLFDGIVCVSERDKVFGKYIAGKLVEQSKKLKIAMILKNWASNEPIPIHVLKGFRNARRVVIVLSEYFEECDWTRWNYFHTNTRIIFIVNGKKSTENIGLSNMFTIKFGGQWFRELKHVMTHKKELNFFDHQDDVEMQPLQNVVTD